METEVESKSVFLLVDSGLTYGVYESLEKVFEANPFLLEEPGDYTVREWVMNSSNHCVKEYQPKKSVTWE